MICWSVYLLLRMGPRSSTRGRTFTLYQPAGTGSGECRVESIPTVKLVTVLSSADPIKIELARNLLETAGILCIVEGVRADSVVEDEFGTYSGLAGAKVVLVRVDHVVRALELLEQALGDETDVL